MPRELTQKLKTRTRHASKVTPTTHKGDAMKKVTTLLAMMAMLALPAAASAQGVGYGTPNGTVQTTIENGPPENPTPTPDKSTDAVPAATTQVADEGDSLPFTGLEVGLVALAGLALVATGFALRKVGGVRSAS